MNGQSAFKRSDSSWVAFFGVGVFWDPGSWDCWEGGFATWGSQDVPLWVVGLLKRWFHGLESREVPLVDGTLPLRSLRILVVSDSNFGSSQAGNVRDLAITRKIQT